MRSLPDKINTTYLKHSHRKSLRTTAFECFISPDVWLHKAGCVEFLSLVPFVHVPGNGILFESIPLREKCVQVYYHSLCFFTYITAGSQYNISFACTIEIQFICFFPPFGWCLKGTSQKIIFNLSFLHKRKKTILPLRIKCV